MSRGRQLGRLDRREFRSIDGSRRSQVVQIVTIVLGLAASAALTIAGSEWVGLRDHGWGRVAEGALFVVIGVVALQFLLGAPARRALLAQRELIDETLDSLSREARRNGFRAEFDEGLRMCGDESSVAELTRRAFACIDTDHHTQLLLADASNAHLSIAAETQTDLPGCGVSTPRECPAVRRGNSRQFARSDGLDACPRLRDRDGGPWCATCMPVTVLGAPVGVVHAVGSAGTSLSEERVQDLETLADLVGSRLSVIRAVSTNERRANTDQLTGLANRRSMSDRIRDVVNREARFSLAFCDLDHFKDLNDTYGHEAGDRALRLFARVLSDTVRDGDVVGRWGGEEFLLLFPDTDRLTAASVCERIRSRLVEAEANGGVPPFTASFGVADQSHGTTVAEVLDVADRAMFEAKTAGRDRVVVADDTIATPAPPQEVEEPVVDV